MYTELVQIEELVPGQIHCLRVTTYINNCIRVMCVFVCINIIACWSCHFFFYNNFNDFNKNKTKCRIMYYYYYHNRMLYLFLSLSFLQYHDYNLNHNIPNTAVVCWIEWLYSNHAN